MPITLSDIRIDGEKWRYSLTKLIGKPIADVQVWISTIGGDATLKLKAIVFEDGTRLDCEGEHDFPYLVQHAHDVQPNFDEGTLERLQDEEEAEVY